MGSHLFHKNNFCSGPMFKPKTSLALVDATSAKSTLTLGLGCRFRYGETPTVVKPRSHPALTLTLNKLIQIFRRAG